MYQGKYATNQPPVKKPAPVRKRKKRTTRGTKIFYSIYALVSVAAIVAILCALPFLRSWLSQFEASQPNHKRDEVFAQLFENPDWKQLYRDAGIADSKFENADSFDAYMHSKVGDKKLTWLETSAGLSGDKKFLVKLGDEKIACFILSGGAASQTDIPEWNLSSLELFYDKNQSIRVERFPGQTVYINGVALDDSYTIQKTSTLAQNYLPDGVMGFQSQIQQVTGLMSQPEVKVVNADGTEAVITYDAETDCYGQTAPSFQIGQEEKDAALNAVQTYAKYMIKKASLGEVQKYFLTGTKTYSTIASSEVGWMQSFSSFSFTEPEYVDYYRYNADTFSVGVNMNLEVLRGNGTTKVYELNSQLIFKKDANGKYMVYEMVNVEIQQRKTEVLLTFLKDDKVITSKFVDASANSLQLPSVEGLTAWVKKGIDEKGNVTLTVVYEAATEVFLPDDEQLTPMELHAYFEKVEKA